MRNVMQLKAFIRNEAKEKGIPAQIVLQNYMLERLLERISVSNYKMNFILKGGFLISALVGLETRTTMDMDATIKGLPMDSATINELLHNISGINLEDGVVFSITRLNEIRKVADYAGFRATLEASYGTMTVPLKLDFTTGDKLTPKEIQYEYHLHFEDRAIEVLAYNLETILAEKLETILSRGDQNTRPRDFYDVYIIHSLHPDNIDINLLRKAVRRTCQKRSTGSLAYRADAIIDIIECSEIMRNHWERYRKEYQYAADISYECVCRTIRELLRKVAVG